MCSMLCIFVSATAGAFVEGVLPKPNCLLELHRQGCIPTWPTTLAALTGFNEATTPGFAAAVAHADRLAAHMFSGASHTVAAPLSI